MNSDERDGTGTTRDGRGSATVTCRVDDSTVSGDAVDLAAAVDAEAVLAAVRDDSDAGVTAPAVGKVVVECPPPGPLFDHVGHVHPTMGLRTKTALARTGRSRGMATPHDEDLADARERLANLSEPDGDCAARREAVTTHERATEELRERVAAARGRLQARRRLDGDTADAAAELRAAIRELTDRETEAIAAQEELAAAQRDARERRSLRERRFELEEAIANLERQARAWLVDQLREEYAEALAALPDASVDEPFAAKSVPAALAIARVGEPAAPLVLSCDRFESAPAAHEWLGCPVIRL